MRDLRMPSGWVHIATNDMAFGNTETKAERVRREQRFNNAIRSIKSDKPVYNEKENTFTPVNLIEEGKAAAAAKDARKAGLVEAFKNKKLKSKALIKEAKGYVKKPAKQKAS